MVDPIINLQDIVLQDKYMLKEHEGCAARLWGIHIYRGPVVDRPQFFRVKFVKETQKILVKINSQILFECDYAQLPQNLVKIESILDNILL